ncbi:methyl-accepting chemotaxis protein [Pantoea sp. 18069]|uniref:methyl-accepting chemotaxis protein n=1 Tax=Pantoea sp. 18069 TaxID=2681415 RepID=UPI0013568F20|nr:methyl-accepting chemotaxis protein [Pantoea sp. 18069]
MQQFLRDVTVRNMVRCVLLLVSTLVIALTAIGNLSLAQAEKTSKARHQLLQEVSALHHAHHQLLHARLQLALIQDYVVMAAAEKQAIDATLSAARLSFEVFAREAGSHVPPSLLQALQTGFHTLLDSGITGQKTLLAAGDMARAAEHAAKVVIPASQTFDQTVARYERHTQEYENQLELSVHENRTQALTGAAILVGTCLLLVVLGDRYVVACVKQPLDDIKLHFQRIADGDLTQPISFFGKNCIGQIVPFLREMQDSLSRTVGSVREGVVQIHHGAAEIAAGSIDLSSRTEEQASSVEQTVASMEELARSVHGNARDAGQARDLATQTNENAKRGGAAVQQAVATMRQISDSSLRINDIISVIDSIAFQTNILALNAAVEAARAGEQGRGFAVVASEVRTLAQRSAVAAKEIKDLITASSTAVAQGSGQVQAAGSTMEDMLESVRRLATLVGKISTASHQQAAGIEEINLAMTQMDQVTQENAALVEQAAGAASALEVQARRLQKAVSLFRLAGDSALHWTAPGAETGGHPASGTENKLLALGTQALKAH